MAARMTFATKRKAERCPEMKERKNKPNEYVAMSKLTSYLYSILISEFFKEVFFNYIADNQD